jgi:hypothetical protein
MADFNFDKQKSPAENISIFFDHLQTVDPEMSAILETYVYELLPLPPAGIGRNTKRQQTNEAIEKMLDSMI